jgi:uncharacterized protein DUF5818
MNKLGVLSRKALPVIAVVIVGFCSIGQTAMAQSAKAYPLASAQQQPVQQGDEQKPAPEAKTFTGKIVKSGDMFVLSDEQNKATYQLDNQKMAKEFVDRNVKVTGVLDESAGMIRVSAIEPA